MTIRSGRFGGLGIATWWRQMRSDVRPNLVIAVVVFATAVAIALAPRVTEHASHLDLSERVATATPEQRNLSFEARREIGAGGRQMPFSNIDIVGNNLRDDHIPPSVSAVLGGDQWVFDTPEFVVSSFPDQIQGPFPTTIRLRYQQGIEDHLRLVAGAMPVAQDAFLRLEGPDCPDDVTEPDEIEAFEPLEDQLCSLVELPVFEVAVTQQTADDMMVSVGQHVTLLPSVTDLSFRNPQVDTHALRFVLRVSGIIELDDQGLEFWYADSSLHRPRITENPDFRLIFAVGLMSADQYRPLRNAAPRVELNFAWRFLVDPELIDQADAAELAADLQKIGPQDVEVITSLSGLLNEHIAQRRLTVQLLSMAAVVFAAAAFAAIWTVALVDAARRRAVTDLIIDRGASRSQLAANAIRTGVLVALPPALGGALAAAVLLRSTSAGPTVLPVVAVATATVVVMLTANLPQRTGRDGGRSRLRRMVAELLLIGLAIAAIVLLRRRATDVAGSASDGFDATLAVAPVAVAIAVGLVAVRLIGPFARILAIVANRMRGASWMIGARRLVGQPLALRAPSLAISIAAMAAVFAAVIYTSVVSAQDIASWQRVGGEHRIETVNPGLPLPERLQDAVTVTDDRPAFGTTIHFQRFTTESESFVANVVALDLRSFQALVEDTAVADSVSAALDGVIGDPVAQSEPLPAVLVGTTAAHRRHLGTSALLKTGPHSIEVQFLSATDHFAGVSPGWPTVLVDRASFAGLTDDRTIAPTFVVLGDRGDLDDQVYTVIEEQGGSASVTSRDEWLARVAGDPLSTWTTRSLWSLALAALIFAVITSAAAAIITAAMRQRDLGVLAILGHERRSLGRLVATELLPGIAIAGALGAAAGAITARLLSDNLSLGAFAVDTGSPGVILDWRPIMLVVVALALTVAFTVALTVRSLRRLDHGMMLRRGNS